MTRNDLLAAARRGEADAIASLLNRQLRTKGMTVRVTTQGEQVTILVEAVQPPPQTPLVNYLRRAFTQLAAPSIHHLRICGTQQGATTFAWTTELNLTPPVDETPSNPSEPLPPPPKPSDESPPPRAEPPPPPLDPLPPPPKPPNTAPDQPVPSGARPPRFLGEWWLVSSGAAVVAVIVHYGLGATLAVLPGAIASFLVDATTCLVLGIAQSYVLTRRLEKSHWWAVTYLVLPLLAMVPILISVLGVWGVQAWILGTRVRRSYWWILSNMAMVVVFAGIAIIGIIVLRMLVFILSFATVFLSWLVGMILVALMLLIQGAILERLLYGVSERSRPAPAQYLQHLYDHIQQDFQRLITTR